MVKKRRVLIMAAGTGGHVFPALAIAEQLALKGAEIHWMVTRRGMEADLLANSGYVLHKVTVEGLRGLGPTAVFHQPFLLVTGLIPETN